MTKQPYRFSIFFWLIGLSISVTGTAQSRWTSPIQISALPLEQNWANGQVPPSLRRYGGFDAP